MTVEPEAERDQRELLGREQEARAEAERAAETLRKLEEVSRAALRHVGTGTLLDELLLQLVRIVEADTCAILLLDDERRFLTIRAALGFDPEVDGAVPIPFGEGMAGRVAASGKPVVIDDPGGVELASPHLRARGIASLVAIPIATEDRVIGVAHAGSTRPRHFDDEDVRLLGLMADRIALAVTQSRLYESERRARRDAEEAHRRLSFLAEASTILSSSLDYEATLQAVARLVVPHLADWCAVDVTESEQELARIAVAHTSLAHDELLQRAGQLRPPEYDDPVGPFAVLRRGLAELAPHVLDDLLGSLAGDDEGAETLRELGFASYMCVPMHGRDHVLGTILFASGEPGRYAEGDLALAEELARSAAAAVENALLYRQVEERAQAARVLAAVGDGVFLVDGRGVVCLWNAAAEAITGLAAADVVGRPASEAIPGWAAVADHAPVSAPPGSRARFEVVPLGLPEGELWLSMSGVGFADGTVYAFRDLTQDRKLEPVQLPIQSFDAQELAAGVIESAEVHRPANVELHLTAPETLPAVAGDPEKVRQVLVNLLDNAVKCSPDGGSIEVELSADAGHVRFSVHDPGLGVPPAERQRIFEKFYRLDPNLTRGVGGTGLGLYISRELVRRMGGRIWVVSPRPGVRGSTFAFEMPVAPRP
jgi:signal transduction histidine kinase